jgi:hypothetical protein
LTTAFQNHIVDMKYIPFFVLLLTSFASATQLDASQFKLTESSYNANIAKLDAILPIVTVAGVRYEFIPTFQNSPA